MPEILITPHARAVFRARIAPGLAEPAVTGALQNAFQTPEFHCPNAENTLTLWGLRHGQTAFVGATDPADEAAPFLLLRTVGPRWFWRETRPFYGQTWKARHGHQPARAAVVTPQPENTLPALVDYPALEPFQRLYAATKKHQPLTVRLTLRANSSLAGYDPLLLDGLLARAVVELATRGGGLPDATPGYRIPLPLTVLGHYGPYHVPLWAATPFAPQGCLVADISTWHKRAQTGQYTYAKSGRYSINSTNGREMERRVPLPVRNCRVWEASAVGDPVEVASLLARFSYVGKRRSIGFGEVERWDVLPADDFTLTETPDGTARLRRSLPAEALSLLGHREPEGEPAPCAFTPPGWKPALWLAGWPSGTIVPAPAPVSTDWYAEAGNL